MKSLYIINQPQKLDEALPYISEHDGILLIEDAVVLAADDTKQLSGLKQYVLEEDLIARGLHEKAENGWELVDYPKFVKLTLEYDKSVSWL
ncbi:sulfurtransferase complex subunit TusB [Kangiella sp. M94]